MAERRMFAKTIIDSDVFLDMPHSTQLLYFHLAMRADDDGFINNPKNIMRMIGCKDDDIAVLITKKFIIPFESGIVVIKHWKIHNYIAKDRYKETKYIEEKSLLQLDENNSYTKCIQNVDKMDTQVRLGKDSIGKDRLNNINKSKPKQKKIDSKTHFAEFVTMTNAEYEKLVSTYSKEFADQCVNVLDNYKGSSGKNYKSDYRAILNWVVDRVKEDKYKQRKVVTENQRNYNSNELDKLYANLQRK